MRREAPQQLIIALTFTVIKSVGGGREVLVQSVSQLLDFCRDVLMLAIAVWLRSNPATVRIGHLPYIYTCRLATICFDLLQLIKVASFMERGLVKEDPRDHIKCCTKAKLYHDASDIKWVDQKIFDVVAFCMDVKLGR